MAKAYPIPSLTVRDWPQL